MARGWRAAWVPLAYAALSWFLFGRGAGLDGGLYGAGSDPGVCMWFLAWWPWAVTHHALALHTHLLWQPYGLNLAWTTSVPLLALLAAPLTATVGPLVAYNLFLLAAPALAAWAAWLLCRGLGATSGAAFCGGLIFGFSSYMAAQSFTHLNLAFSCLIPLAVLVAVRRVRGVAGRCATVLGLAVLLGGEFLISEEILATFCLFSALGFLLAYGVEPARRPALAALAIDAALAAPLALLPAIPFLLAMLRGPHDVAHPAGWTGFFSVDALNFLLPTAGSWFGGGIFAAVSRHFTGALDEQSGYLGLPVLLLLAAILRDADLRRRLWLPFVMLALALLAALGPRLHVGGHVTGIVLPWAGVAHLPLLGAALPARCMIYAFLALAIIVSQWLSAVRLPAGPAPGRVMAAACICLSLLPVPHPAWPSPYEPLFRPGRLQQLTGANPILLVLPFGIEAPDAFWQAENEFGFTLAGGYLGYPPAWAQHDPAVMQLFLDDPGPGFARDFAALCRLRRVQFVAVGPATPAAQQAALASLRWSAQRIGDITLYTVPKFPGLNTL